MMVCRIVQLVRTSAERQNVGGSIPPTATNEKIKDMIRCKICGEDKEEKNFKTYKLKNGEISHMKVCNSCRSKRDYPRIKTNCKLKRFTDLELLIELEARGRKVFFK